MSTLSGNLTVNKVWNFYRVQANKGLSLLYSVTARIEEKDIEKKFLKEVNSKVIDRRYLVDTKGVHYDLVDGENIAYEVVLYIRDSCVIENDETAHIVFDSNGIRITRLPSQRHGVKYAFYMGGHCAYLNSKRFQNLLEAMHAEYNEQVKEAPDDGTYKFRYYDRKRNPEDE